MTVKRPRAAVQAEPAPVVTADDIEHFTIAEAAVKLRVGKRTLAGRVARGEVPHTRQGRLVFFRLDHLLAISQAGDVLPTRRSA